MDAGEVYGATCTVSIKHDYSLLGSLSKAVCSFVDGEDGYEGRIWMRLPKMREKP